MPQRNSQYYEKVSDPLDLSTIEKQILTGHYKTVEAFDTDMLKVFRNAEVGNMVPKSNATINDPVLFKSYMYLVVFSMNNNNNYTQCCRSIFSFRIASRQRLLLNPVLVLVVILIITYNTCGTHEYLRFSKINLHQKTSSK